MALETVVKQTPAEGMKIQQAQTNPVGGKVIIFDGKTEKPVDAKPADGTDGTKGTDAGKPAADKPADAKLDDGLKALRKSLGFWKEEKETDSQSPIAKKKAEDDAAAAAKAAEKPASVDEEKPKVVKKARPGMTPEMMETVAQTAARAAVEANKAAQPKPEKPASEEDDLSVADKRDLEVFQYLEKQSPDTYKGAAKQFVKFTKEFAKYQTKWEEENAGKAFDPQAEEHDAFYEKHQPKHDPADLDEARLNMRLEKKLKERDREHEDRYGQLESRLLEKDLAPAIDKKAGEAVAAMVGEVDPELAKVLAEKGPDAVMEADPVAFDVLDRSASDLRNALTELEKLSHPSGRFRFDKANPVHESLDRFAIGIERSIKEMAMEDQVRDGKMFATQTELRGIPENQRGRYWTLTPADIAASLVSETAQASKKIIAAERARMEKYLKGKGLSATKTTEGDKSTSAAAGNGSAEKPKSPAAATDAGNAAAMKLGEGGGDPAIKSLVGKLFPA